MPNSRPTPFVEVAERVWVAAFEWLDVNVTVVGGADGLVVVDTHASAVAARAVVDDVRALGAGAVVALVNTHEHFDHTLGNGTFRATYGELPIHAHEDAEIVAAADRVKALYDQEPDDPHAAEVIATEPVAADRTFSSVRTVDLGDRVIELVHPGRGHTAGDLVVRIGDVDVLLAGDLIEEAGPGVPGFGPDCYPLEWPLTVDLALGLCTPGTLVVPGHGRPVDREFVERQRDDIGVMAETIRDLAGRGVRVDEALAAADSWPFPTDRLADAVRRGYEHLPRSQKRLPLI